MGGVLDSRFTFSRASNATYVNSSGYVAWNNSNLFLNTAWTSTSLPTGWGEGITGGTFTYNGNGTITMSVATAQRAVLIPASPYVPTQTGVPFTISFTVTAVSGSPTLGDVITTNAGTDTFTVNGVTKTSAQEVFANDLITCTSTATATAHAIRIGMGVGGNVTGKSITVKNPQANIGSTAQPYTANTSTTTSYYAPRFDYNPTTLAANGLLIEGAATNLLNFSETFATTGGTNNNWADTNLTRTSTNNTSPRNDATALRITASAANGTIISSTAISTSAARTLSVWLRRVTGTGNIQYTLDNGTTYTTQAITAVWVRYTFATTTAAQRVGFRIVTSADAIEIWGVQLEDGTGASSYIPTGASQITRAADECYMADISSFNYSNTNGTIATQLVYTKHALGYIEQIGFMAAGDQPTLEIFLNPSTALYTAARGTSLNTGGANEIGSTITLNTLIKYAVSANVVTDPIVQTNMNGTAASTNKSGTGNMYTATRFVFGRLPTAGYGAYYGSLTIKSVKYWPLTKTATELAALTA